MSLAVVDMLGAGRPAPCLGRRAWGEEAESEEEGREQRRGCRPKFMKADVFAVIVVTGDDHGVGQVSISSSGGVWPLWRGTRLG